MPNPVRPRDLISGPMAAKERAAHKAISEATEQLERLQTHSISTDDEPKKRGPGRPPKEPVSLEQAEQALEAACREHARLAAQREQVKAQWQQYQQSLAAKPEEREATDGSAPQ